jgi:hypothetical protein
VDLLAFTLRTLDNTDQEYRLPLNEEQVELGRILLDALHRKEKDIGAIHNLFYTFMTPPAEDQPFSKWNDALLCFLAVTNLREDGTFEPAAALTGQLCRWEYNMRGTALYEAVTGSKKFGTVVRLEMNHYLTRSSVNCFSHTQPLQRHMLNTVIRRRHFPLQFYHRTSTICILIGPV